MRMTDSDKIKAALSLLLQASPERLDGVLRYLSEPETAVASSGGPGHVVARCASEATAPMAGVVAELDRAMASRCDEMVRTLERMERNLELVAKDKIELRRENEELRRLNKDGYFNFAVRVRGEDFLTFAVIMALGNRKAAADHLKIPHRTLYNRVDHWSARGKEYQLMLRYLEWRKRSSRHLKVELNPSLQSGEAGARPENPETMRDVLTEIAAADNRNYPALFAEVLEALERQNAGNWMKVRQELLEMIREDVMQ